MASPEPGIVARLEGVSHRYRNTTALDAVTLAIPAGVMAGVIGPDGVGKSTLLALIAGVRAIQQGSVAVLGGDMAARRHRTDAEARIAYMPQGLGRNLYPTLTVAENLDFFGRLFGLDRAARAARLADLLVRTGLAPFRDRAAGKLSGGMKQKLGLCCALIHEPDLLVLDEPTTGIDPLSRRQFWRLIGDIRARRPAMSVLVATAYMEEAERFDWLAVLDGGRLIASGPPAGVLGQTGAADLEAAFIALLPQERRRGHSAVVLPPRPQREGPPVIEAQGLTMRFGDFVAVDDVSFRIETGEIFGFLGSNGCGKSTTMKMLTGLLAASEGQARLFGRPVDSGDMETRRRVGYMSQSFSLYRELTVRQNLELHAQLFHLPRRTVTARIAELLERYDLGAHADAMPESLPLGMRQRLQLAVAVLHRPEVLILDEPTSGVDPIARDAFWRSLIALSRQEGVTIFLSTHFLNEAARCDRISLMHAGKVLAVGTPGELVAGRGAADLEEAFIGYLEEAAGDDPAALAAATPSGDAAVPALLPGRRRVFDPRRCLAYARRESVEVLRDPIRLAFALLGPLLLMVAFGYGITFDVEHLGYSALDQDRSPESRELLAAFDGSRYFDRMEDLVDHDGVMRALRSGDLRLAVEIPPGFGKDLLLERRPEVAVWLDGAMPYRAETVRGYVNGLAARYLADRALETTGAAPAGAPFTMETRFRYNQEFRSANAIVPGVVMLLLVLIPAMMTAVGVVREKETGSIANFRATPTTRLEFLLGKQLPYAAIAALSGLSLVALALLLFAVPLKGSALALLLGIVLYVLATTAFGLLISAFTRSQVAAIFAAAIISTVPAIHFSGMLTPVSALSPGTRFVGYAFPSSWFQQVSVGTFTKGLGLAELWPDMLALAAFFVLFLLAAMAALAKQER